MKAWVVGIAAAAVLTVPQAAWEWKLPEGVAPPTVPADNPMSAAKVELGRHLFYDKRLSGNQSFSCATCHSQAAGFADTHAQAVGSTGETHPRGAPGLVNVAYLSVLTWADPSMDRLERQAMVPMFNEHPVELGLTGLEDALVDRLVDVPRYQELFRAAFPGDGDPVTLTNVTRAIASFERSLVSFETPWDLARRGNARAMSPAAHRGEALFNDPRVGCAACHAPPLFTYAGAPGRTRPAPVDRVYFNTGLYNIGADGRYPPRNEGLFAVTGQPSDMGRFRTPSLRNVAVSAPYMHDGSIATLADVVDLYAQGGRVVGDGPYAGDGRASPWRTRRMRGFRLSPRERADLVSFLGALTDPAFLTDPAHGDPWP